MRAWLLLLRVGSAAAAVGGGHSQRQRRAAVLLLRGNRWGVGGLGGADDRRVHAIGGLVGGGEADVGAADLSQSGGVLGEGQRAGDAAGVAAPLGPVGGGERVVGDDVADPDPPAGTQHPEHLGEHRRLVR